MVWMGGKSGTRRGLLDLECSGGKASGCTSTARGSGGHLSIGSKGRTGQVPVPGTPLGASPCQVLSPEKCQQNFQADHPPPLTRTDTSQGEHSGFKAWQMLLWLVRLGSWMIPVDPFCLGIFCDPVVEILRAITNIQK